MSSFSQNGSSTRQTYWRMLFRFHGIHGCFPQKFTVVKVGSSPTHIPTTHWNSNSNMEVETYHSRKLDHSQSEKNEFSYHEKNPSPC